MKKIAKTVKRIGPNGVVIGRRYNRKANTKKKNGKKEDEASSSINKPTNQTTINQPEPVKNILKLKRFHSRVNPRRPTFIKIPNKLKIRQPKNQFRVVESKRETPENNPSKSKTPQQTINEKNFFTKSTIRTIGSLSQPNTPQSPITPSPITPSYRKLYVKKHKQSKKRSKSQSETTIRPEIKPIKPSVQLPRVQSTLASENKDRADLQRLGWFPQLSPIFVISIRDHRWKDMQRILSCVPREQLIHWPGTDGRKINREQWVRDGKIAGPQTFRRGQIGCYESHRRIWQHIVDNNLKFALILEDDADINCGPAMIGKIRQLLTDVNNHDAQWQLLYLARSRLRQPIVRSITSSFAIPKYKSWGCFAYAVSLSAAKILLSHSTPMRHSLDSFVSLISSRYLRTYCAWPSLFYVRSYKSDTTHIL